MRLLIVEDNPTDKELLRFLLESRFPPQETKFLEATRLSEALLLLGSEPVDAIVLDLTLPDSTGKETFLALQEAHPDVAIIVMTHNKDRDLAVELIRDGAADFVIKNYTDEEELFRRIMFAIEKHRRTVRVPPENAESVHKLERMRARLDSAHERGSITEIRDMTVQTTSAMANLTHQTFAEIQKLGTQQLHLLETVENLDKELLRGHSGRPSMRSQVDLLTHRVGSVESKVRELEDDQNSAENTQRQTVLQLEQTKMTNRTKVLVAILALLGVLATAIATYEVGRQSTKKEQKK